MFQRCLHQYVQQHQEYSQQPQHLQHQFIQQQQFPQLYSHQPNHMNGHSHNSHSVPTFNSHTPNLSQNIPSNLFPGPYIPSSHQGGISFLEDSHVETLPGALPGSANAGSNHPSNFI